LSQPVAAQGQMQICLQQAVVSPSGCTNLSRGVQPLGSARSFSSTAMSLITLCEMSRILVTYITEKLAFPPHSATITALDHYDDRLPLLTTGEFLEPHCGIC
jgi:hypothetical protein